MISFLRATLLLGTMALPLMAEVSLTTLHPDIPILRRKSVNPALGFTLALSGPVTPVTLEEVEISLAGTTHPQDIAALSLVPGDIEPSGKFGTAVATTQSVTAPLTLTPRVTLGAGSSTFWVSVTLKDQANLDGRIAVSLRRVKVGGKALIPAPLAKAPAQRIGVALRLQGDDGSHSYRIPGLVQTKAGSLIAVYDVRREHCRDLPARIDVGVSRSTNGGQTWEDLRIAMRPGTMDPAYAADGVGDPTILVDNQTGRIWVAALWSHGDHGWETSAPGLDPDQTGQLLLTSSDDDGKTWAPLRNLTRAVKNPAWRLCFNNPGAGICLKDGTLVFPAMFRSANGGETLGKPFSTILWSKDHGATWTMGTGAKIDTTEAQVVELDDGSLMLNCRDNRGGARTVMVTRDLGKSWSAHPTDRNALPEPVCMASLLRWDHPQHGTFFAFSNPASTTGRHNMTVKVSRDQALTWPEQGHLRYDSRKGSGYSCLAQAGPNHLGVIYEGSCELYYLRIPLAEFFPLPRL